jgi:hypothetical protein
VGAAGRPFAPGPSVFVAGGYEVALGHEEELLGALSALHRPKGPGTRARASRGRPVRRRGSRRIARASSSDDPGLADEPPEHLAVAA